MPKEWCRMKENEINSLIFYVECLMYVLTCTRPYISFVVGMLERYQNNPEIDHWKTAKKVCVMLWNHNSYNIDVVLYFRTWGCPQHHQAAENLLW